MLVPKASVDKDGFLAFSKNQVWLTWEVFRMEAIPEAETMYERSYDEFEYRAAYGIGYQDKTWSVTCPKIHAFRKIEENWLAAFYYRTLWT